MLVGDLASALGEHALITITDGQGAIVYANDNFCALTRYSREELLGSDRRLLTGPYNPERLFQDLWSTVASGRTWKGEVKHRAKDGSFYWVDTTVVPVPDSSGTTVRLIGIHTDITAMKQLQQSLQENEQRYQDLVQMSPDVIFLTDGGLITFVNDAGLRLLRADRPEQLLGRLSLDFFHPDDHGRIGRRIEALLQGPGSVPALEETMIALDGTEVPVEVSAVSYLVDGKLIVQAICRDISERKAIEERWRQEHEYAEAVLNGLPGIVYHYDESGHFLRWNENLEGVTGYGPEEIAAMRPRDFFPQEQQESITRRLTEAFDVGAAHVEVEIVTKAGHRIPYLFTAVRIEHNGRPHIIGVGIDISERKATELALRDSLARFHAVTRATGEAMWEWDVITGAKWRNENYESLLRQPQALAGSADWSWDDRIHPEDRQRVLAHIRQVVDGPEETWTDEYRLRLDDGSYAEVFDRGIVLRDETGRSLRMVGAMQDITERKRAEAALRDSLERFHAVARATGDVVWNWDLTTDMLWWNENFQILFGYRQEEIEPTIESWTNRVHPDDRERVVRHIYEIIDGDEETWTDEYRFRRKDGSYAHVFDRGHVMRDARGYGVRMVGAIQDITERILAQARLIAFNAELEQRVADRTHELKTLNQELESFAYSVSHDLRAPLRGIAGFTKILARDHGGALGDTAKDYLGRVLAATSLMSELIDGLLDLSRVSRDEMHIKRVDLSTMARDVLGELREADPLRQVEASVEDGLEAMGDPRLLRIVLGNLLGNAWKFSAKTDRACVSFSATQGVHGDRSFIVSDNGAGFDMRYASKLFGPFQRLHRTTEFPGTGIGLATVQRIIHRHGGSIAATAEPDKGATFTFTLEQPKP